MKTMKLSIFNSEIRISEKYLLLFNAVTNQFLVLNPSLQKVWNRFPHPDFEQINPSFFNQLVENGFLVEYAVDESAQLKQTFEETDNNRSDYFMIVNPTLDCNFQCWYCYEEHFPSKMSADTLEKVCRHMELQVTQTEELKRLSICFFGGEPLLYYSSVVRPLIAFGKELCEKHGKKFFVSFTTNGYLLSEKRIREITQMDKVSMQITLDGCREEHDLTRFTRNGKPSYDMILQNVKELLKNDCRVTLRINFTEKNLEEIPRIIADLQDILDEDRKKLYIDFHQVWQNKASSPDLNEPITEIINKFKEAGFLVTHQTNHRVYNSCYADKKYGAVINYNGDVYRCTARDFKNFKRDGFLSEDGNILWENNSDLKRQQAKMHNEHCRVCRIAPICGGGCTQYALDNFEKKKCVNDFDEKKKDDRILSHFQNYFMNIHR